MSPPHNANRTNLFGKRSIIQIAHKVLFTIGLSACYVLTCGFPFCYYSSLASVEAPQAVTGATRSVDIERAGAQCLERQIKGWNTIRVASGVIAVGVGVPAIVLYFRSWLLVEKWSEIFLMLSVVLSTTSFSFASILISSFADWSGDVSELKSDLLAWSILFSIPNIALAWSAMSLVTAAATLAANKIVFSSAIDYFETAIAVLMFFIGLAVTTLFYMVHSIWKL